MVRLENQCKPATKRQLFALFLASKAAGSTHDYRNDGLTMQQASELLEQFNSKRPMQVKAADAKPIDKEEAAMQKLRDEFLEYFKKHCLNEFVGTFRRTIGIVSKVSDDPQFTPEGKRKSYVFFGVGCSIGWLKYRKGNKRAERIDEACRQVRKECIKMVMDIIGKKECQMLERMGSPAEAIISQDYNMNSLWLSAKRTFMEMKGVKNVEIVVHYD